MSFATSLLITLMSTIGFPSQSTQCTDPSINPSPSCVSIQSETSGHWLTAGRTGFLEPGKRPRPPAREWTVCCCHRMLLLSLRGWGGGHLFKTGCPKSLREIFPEWKRTQWRTFPSDLFNEIRQNDYAPRGSIFHSLIVVHVYILHIIYYM